MNEIITLMYSWFRRRHFEVVVPEVEHIWLSPTGDPSCVIISSTTCSVSITRSSFVYEGTICMCVSLPHKVWT